MYRNWEVLRGRAVSYEFLLPAAPHGMWDMNSFICL